MSRDEHPLRLAEVAAIRRMRETLDRINYTTAGIVEAAGAGDSPTMPGKDLPVLLHRTRTSRPLDLAIRLFLVGMPIEIAAIRQAFPGASLEEWCELGLVSYDDASVTANVELLPYQDLLLAFDFDGRSGVGPRPDYVMGIGRSTLTLANITVRRPSRLTLDLGTGCGVQAFLAARHSDRVIGIDRNPRALNLARFNALLNGIGNVEFVEGDLFAPVAGQRFDLVVSNPPFVISPAARYIYRDGGMAGDRLCRRIVREVAPLLNDDGYCQILCNWATVAGQDWRARLAEWFQETGCDAWVIRSETHDAATYASTWIRHTEGGDPASLTRRFDEWMAYYERERIEAMTAGIINLRRVHGRSPWFRADDGPEKMLGPCGDEVVLAFAFRDFLERMCDDDTLMAQRLRLSPHARLTQECEASADAWRPVRHEIRLVRGLGYVGGVDAYIASVLARCDGERPLRALLTDLASELRVELERLVPECLRLVRQLIERGFLWPAELR